jgi:hypothetical protein
MKNTKKVNKNETAQHEIAQRGEEGSVDNGEREYLKDIIFTVAYYNALDYCPTTFFVWKHLLSVKRKSERISPAKVVEGLDFLKKQKKVYFKNGFWRVSGAVNRDWKRGVIYKHQIQKNKISTDKIKQAKRWSDRLGWLPYLEGLMLTGTLAMKRGGTDSDWDVLVVMKKDRIWLGRFVLSIWLNFVRKRRFGKYIRDRFCLNQFMVEDRLEFQERNEFAANEILASQQLLGQQNIKNKLIEENKKWIKRFKPNFKFRRVQSKLIVSRFQMFIKSFLEKFLEMILRAEFLNKVLKKIMIKKINNNPKTYIEEADIRYSDFFLVFLPHPQRDVVRAKTYNFLTKKC